MPNWTGDDGVSVFPLELLEEKPKRNKRAKTMNEQESAAYKKGITDGLADGKRQGAAEERARIVAWLDAEGYSGCAGSVERGEHTPKG